MRMKFTDICETHKNFMKNVNIEDFLFQKGSFYSIFKDKKFYYTCVNRKYFISDVTMI